MNTNGNSGARDKAVVAMDWHWHQRHLDELQRSAHIADIVAAAIGSWPFILIQTGITIAWVILNVVGWRYQWDLYPFVLLNLFFSLQAFYAAPLILMAQNRQADRDRFHSQHDYEVNLRAKEEIEELQISLARIEAEKLDRIIALLEQSDH